MAEQILSVLSAGMLSTVQDLGRGAYSRFGFVASGAMDSFALQVGNRLVGNPVDAAAIEMTVMGGSFRAERDVIVAVTGGDLNCTVDGRPAPMWQALLVRTGSVLSFDCARLGSRAYLCPQGGVDVPQILGSRSTDLKVGFGGFEGRKLQQGDVICGSSYFDEKFIGKTYPQAQVDNIYRWHEQVTPIRVIMGSEQDHFSPQGIDTFLSTPYRVGVKSDRQGVNLQGERIEHSTKGANIITNATPLGAIQVPGSGSPVILLADSQSVGGYPKIAVVLSCDICRLAQLLPDTMLQFIAVDLAEGQTICAEYNKSITWCGMYEDNEYDKAYAPI